jgi:large subunit ribosomal protein L22
MKAILTNYRQSPRKVGLVAGLIRGKKVADALVSLQFATKRASDPMLKLLKSAIANAKNSGIDNPEALFVNEIRVDKGVVLKRFMPRARGSSARILKRSSNVILSLGEKRTKGTSSTKKAEVAPAVASKKSITVKKAVKAPAKTKAKATK